MKLKTILSVSYQSQKGGILHKKFTRMYKTPRNHELIKKNVTKMMLKKYGIQPKNILTITILW